MPSHETTPFSLQATDKQLQQRVAMALARLAKPTDLRECFVNRKGLEILLELLTDSRKEASVQKEAAGEPPHVSRLCKHEQRWVALCGVPCGCQTAAIMQQQAACRELPQSGLPDCGWLCSPTAADHLGYLLIAVCLL